jgi:hypothetical protein
MRQQEFCVLHVAALENGEALQVLTRTTKIIAALGVGQVLLALEGSAATNATWIAALAAEVRPLRCAGFSLIRSVRALQSEFSILFRERGPCAVHLHGIVPCLLGLRALKGFMLHGRVLYSPHGEHAGPAWANALVGRLLQSHLSPFHYAPLAASPTEAQALSKLLNRSAEVLPPPVPAVFFAVARREDARPTIIANGCSPEAVDIVTRLCVLLNGREARVAFSWLGPVKGGTSAQLAAANIELIEVLDDDHWALLLSHVWLFIDMSVREPLSVAVAQAMAAGVPCLVSDTPGHRAVIHHGDTGFVCTSERDLVEKVVVLLRDRAERTRIGEAARAEAARRFSQREFQRAVLRAYGFSSVLCSS